MVRLAWIAVLSCALGWLCGGLTRSLGADASQGEAAPLPEADGITPKTSAVAQTGPGRQRSSARAAAREAWLVAAEGRALDRLQREEGPARTLRLGLDRNDFISSDDEAPPFAVISGREVRAGTYALEIAPSPRVDPLITGPVDIWPELPASKPSGE